LPNLFEARRRLPTSATALTTCGQPNPSSSILAGTEASTSFLFLRATPLPIAGSGDARRAALRPVAKTPVTVSLTCVSLPDRDAHSTASPPKLSPRSVVRIYVHGSKDRAKDASPSACDDLSCLRWVHTLCGACRRRSPPRQPSDIRCRRRVCLRRRIPLPADSGRPRPSFQRRPAKRAAFRKTGMPFTATSREGFVVAEGLLPPAFAPALLLTPPTLFPQVGDSAFDRALRGHGAVTRGSVKDSRVQTPL